MAGYSGVAVAALLIVVYGALPFVGGLFWYAGWKRESERMARAGDVTVLVGLWTDAALVTANWLFGWVALLQARMM